MIFPFPHRYEDIERRSTKRGDDRHPVKDWHRITNHYNIQHDHVSFASWDNMAERTVFAEEQE